MKRDGREEGKQQLRLLRMEIVSPSWKSWAAWSVRLHAV